MDADRSFTIAFLLTTLGAVLLAAATIPPREALANIGDWLQLVRLGPVPGGVAAVGLMLGINGVVVGVFMVILKRRAYAAAQQTFMRAVEENMRRPVGTGHP